MKTCKCRKCRRWWSVSVRARVPRKGYICPECEGWKSAWIRDGRRMDMPA